MEALPEEISADVFCEQVLGFEEIDDIEETGEEDELMGASEAGGDKTLGGGGAIPEEAEVDETRAY